MNSILRCRNRSPTRKTKLVRSSTVVRLQESKAASAAFIAGSTCSLPAFWWTPTICEGCDGFSDLILSVVLIRLPPMMSSYSWPNCPRTLAIAERMRRALSSWRKSKKGSVTNGPSCRVVRGRTGASSVAIGRILSGLIRAFKGFASTFYTRRRARIDDQSAPLTCECHLQRRTLVRAWESVIFIRMKSAIHTITPRSRTLCRMCVLPGLFLVLVVPIAIGAQDAIGVTEITPQLLVFSTAAGNVIASVGPEGALLVGTPAAASTPRIASILASRTKPPVRYVVIAQQDLAHSEGDAGWGRRGAFVAMQENALRRLGGDTMSEVPPPPPQFVKLGVDRPRIAFSEVLAFDLNGESIHIVRQKAGYSDADAIVHF